MTFPVANLEARDDVTVGECDLIAAEEIENGAQYLDISLFFVFFTSWLCALIQELHDPAHIMVLHLVSLHVDRAALRRSRDKPVRPRALPLISFTVSSRFRTIPS